MDPKLLALLPDAAKLGILRHLGSAQQAQNQQQQAQPPPPPPLPPPPQHQQQRRRQQPAGPQLCDRETGLLPAVVGRSLAGGLAVIDGFMQRGEVEVRGALAAADAAA